MKSPDRFQSAVVLITLFLIGITACKKNKDSSVVEISDVRTGGTEKTILMNFINNSSETVTALTLKNQGSANMHVKLVKDNLDQSNQRVKDFTNLEKNGLVAKNDLLKVKLQSSNIELTLLDAESNYKLANVNMALMLGLPEQTVFITDATSLQQSGSLKSIEEYEQLALLSRNDVGALALRKKAADLGPANSAIVQSSAYRSRTVPPSPSSYGTSGYGGMGGY